jgi:hypothetical protein
LSSLERTQKRTKQKALKQKAKLSPKENAFALAENILIEENKFIDENFTDEKFITSETALNQLDSIIKQGFMLYNYMIKHKLWQDEQDIIDIELEVQKNHERISSTDENAKKLTLTNSLQIWQELNFIFTSLAVAVISRRIQ